MENLLPTFICAHFSCILIRRVNHKIQYNSRSESGHISMSCIYYIQHSFSLYQLRANLPLFEGTGWHKQYVSYVVFQAQFIKLIKVVKQDIWVMTS